MSSAGEHVNSRKNNMRHFKPMSINIDQKIFPKKILKTAPSEFITNFFRKKLRPLSTQKKNSKKFLYRSDPAYGYGYGGVYKGGYGGRGM